MLVVEKLTKVFPSSEEKVRAVSNVSFSIASGVCGAVVGPSGSGKSTLMSLLGALDTPDSGTITLDDIDVTGADRSRLLEYRQRHVGFVFQSFNLVPNLTAIENVMLPMEFVGTARRQRSTRAAELLESVGLTGAKHSRRPSRLSGGEQQRVAIARSLANGPKLLLADEPTGNLDSKTSASVFAMLRGLAHVHDTTVLIVTHDLALAAKADVSFEMEDGRLSRRS
jgi:putative ABC transport system ATP-binding protein